MAQGVNDMVAGHIAVKKKAMACVAEFGKGNFEAPLERFPGKKAFINDTIEEVRTHLKRLVGRRRGSDRRGAATGSSISAPTRHVTRATIRASCRESTTPSTR